MAHEILAYHVDTDSPKLPIHTDRGTISLEPSPYYTLSVAVESRPGYFKTYWKEVIGIPRAKEVQDAAENGEELYRQHAEKVFASLFSKYKFEGVSLPYEVNVEKVD